jgi:Spy/CpxP family protein refolding chaperone
MRKFLIPALVLSTVVGVAPAAANHGGYHSDQGHGQHAGWNRGGPSRQAINELLRDLQRAENGIQRSVQRRVISQREATGLRREANQIERRLNLASRNGISGREFGALRVQVNRLEQRLRIERQDRDGRRY